MYIALIFITLTFGFILLNVLNNKKISLISLICFSVMILYYISYHLNNIYYIELKNKVDNIDFYYKIFCIISLIISFLEYFIGHKLLNKNNKKEETNQQPISLKSGLVLNDLNVFIEMLNEPVAFYSENEYLLNNKMKNYLKIDKHIIDEQTLFSLINTSDVNSLNNSKKQSLFRFKINKDKWFEEISITIDNKKYKMIREGVYTNKRIELYTFKDLNNFVKELNTEEKNYYLLFIDIYNAKEIKSIYGKDTLDLVINKYLNNINDLPFLFNLKMYYISYKEYVILLEDKNQYDIILSSLQDNSSSILKDEIMISENIINLRCKIGLVEKNELYDPSLIISKGYDILKLACSEDYPGDFAIYSKSDEDISFIDLDLDINLEKYKQRLQ